MIEVGDTVECLEHLYTRFSKGATTTVLGIAQNGNLQLKGGEPWDYAPTSFKKVKGAEMNNIEQLKKEHKEMGETIKRMEEAAEPVWLAADIKCNIDIGEGTHGDHQYAIIEANDSLDYALLNITTGCMTSSGFVKKSDLAIYLNENGYTKA